MDKEDKSALVYGMPAHEGRQIAVGEVHSRPYLLVHPFYTLVRLAFMNEVNLVERPPALDQASPEQPPSGGLQHELSWRQGALYCERHTEFSTYLWRAPLVPGTDVLAGENPFKHDFAPPGPVICGVRLDILPWSIDADKLVERFDSTSLCHSRVEDGLAEIITDFRQDAEGLTRILVLDHGLAPARLSALAHRLLEIETYRTLALLAIPTFRQLMPHLRDIEKRLTLITDEMRVSARSNSEALLSQLTDLSAALEADTAKSLYRFGASRAYYEIVEERLVALEEEAVPGCYRWRNFLLRRIAPAMRTCRSVEKRQADLSDKLARATSLLRSWIDIHLERQNGDLLSSMNNRARIQLQLQQTVEGLSVVAISYYVVGLLSHLLNGIKRVDDIASPDLIVSISVPLVVLVIWLIIRGIRRSHKEVP